MKGKNDVNVSKAFLLFVSTVGDCEKTAETLGLDPAFIRKLAEEEGWYAKIERLTVLNKSGNPKDYAIQANRAMNFILAHQTREVLAKVLDKFKDMSPEEIVDSVSSISRTGIRTVSGRFFADFSAALEKCAQLSYTALGDSAGERKDKANEGEDVMDSGALHAAVISALNNPKVKAIDVLTEVKEELDGAQKRITAGSDVVSELKAGVDASVKKIADSPEPPAPVG
jgi:hypothetical protein